MTGSQHPKTIPIEDTPIAAPRSIEAPPLVYAYDYTPFHHSQVSPRYVRSSRSQHSRKSSSYAPSVNAAPAQPAQLYYNPTSPSFYAQPQQAEPTLLHHPTPLAHPTIPRSALSHHSHHPTHANDSSHPHAHFAPSLTEGGTSASRRLSKTPAPGTLLLLQVLAVSNQSHLGSKRPRRRLCMGIYKLTDYCCINDI